ncbi:hypothetical protein MWU65_07250 [Cellulophaga sp. F20128]|uniref:hypothetical protein n=1 Tax=Cellulophaga sp. F20128 TaxID=2926413 RepID=UPI001FF45C89|nr:hypothetical protein [Cellulophaga sp. F20128]MCK0156971.1 hypothetical protein [Cellulophaga sp. F20128]
MTRISNSALKKIIKAKQLYFLGVIFFSLNLLSQNKENSAKALGVEKIYLQLDSNVYTNNSNIWFKAIVTNATNHEASLLSGVLYVELIGLNQVVIEKKIVKLSNGIGHNFFALPKSFQPGKYMIRAYTEWSKNFGSDFMFKTYIDVFSSFKKEEGKVLENVTLTDNGQGSFTLQAKLNPNVLDSLQKKDLTVFLKMGSTTDTLKIKRDNSLGYVLNYEADTWVNDVTFELETENLIRHRETILLDDKFMDLQFFPESGEMVDGIRSKVAFKVIDHVGKGVGVEGEVLDQNNEVVGIFRSNALGMGSLYLQADKTKTYFAKITKPAKLVSPKKFPLPRTVANGTVLSVKKSKEKIRVAVLSNQAALKNISLRVTSRGTTYFQIKGELKNGELHTDALLSANLPEGILAFTVLDALNNPLVERLYFNERPESKLEIVIKTDKDKYAPRDKTIVNIKTQNSKGETKNADISVLVLNQKELGKLQNKRSNIYTYFLLDSELRGQIENPNYYFNESNPNRWNDMDALMLTQGWRKYKYDKPFTNSIEYKNEPALSASGRVGVPFNEIGKDGLELIMMTFGKTPSVFNQQTNDKGWFHFLMNDKYGEPLQVLVQSKDKEGKLKTFPILLDKKTPPKIEFGGVQEIKKLDSMVYAYINTEYGYNALENDYKRENGITYLNEVVVEARKLTPKQKKSYEMYGEPDVVIDGDAIRDKEESWSYGLYSVLMFSFPDDIYVYDSDTAGFLVAEIYGGGLSRRIGDRGAGITIDGNSTSSGTAIGAGIRADGAGPINIISQTLVLVDGTPVASYNYDALPDLPVSEVLSVEVIRSAKNFAKIYMEVYPKIDPRDIPMSGSILSIYTKDGTGLTKKSKAKGQFITSIPVFSPTKEFYAPKYDGLQLVDPNIPDLRSVIHWSPQLKANNVGAKFTTFYNADVSNDMLIVVEAISEDGLIGYQELTYEVREEGVE